MSIVQITAPQTQNNFRWLIQKLIMKMNRDSDRNSEEAAYRINRGALTCFTTLCNTLSINNRVIEVNLSGCNINVYYAIEISGLIQKNKNIQILNLGDCKINSFGLSCIFKAMIDHTGLKILNLFNNQAFTTQVVQDFCRYVLGGKNFLQEINLSHCNIENSLLAQIMDKTHNLSSLRRLKLSLMNLNYEGIIALSSMMLNYTGKLSLDYLDISYNQIKNDGIALLARALFMSVRLIKIKSLNLNGNQITQTDQLEQIILKIQLEELYLSHNKIVEFQNQHVLTLKLLKIDLSHNRIEEIPNNFFLNVMYLNLSNNLIDTEGAYQISQVLCCNIVQWAYLDLSTINSFQVKLLQKGLTLTIKPMSQINFYGEKSKWLHSCQAIYNRKNKLFSQLKINTKIIFLNCRIHLCKHYSTYNNKIKTKGFISIVYALIENISLISLSVSKNQIDGEGILVYVFNHEQIRLQYLDVSLNQLRYDIVYTLISMMKESRLKTLLLSQLIIDDNEIQSGKQDCFEIKCTNLRELDFSFNPHIMYPVLESLSNQYNRLEYLNLNSCQLNEPILIERLSQLIEKTYTLTTLLIAHNNLGDLNISSFEFLNSALSKNSTLINLDISSNKLKNAILLLISGISNCCSLKVLNISNNLIDENEVIVRKLPLLFKNRNLQFVDMSKNWIHGQTLFNIKAIIQKMHLSFPQLLLSNLKLTADDLLIISDIISDIYSFKILDISMNQSIDYMNNFTALQDNQTISSLTINKMQCRLESYQNLQQVLKRNKHSLKIIEISNTLISHNYLYTLLQGMKYTKSLTSLILEYQVIESYALLNAFHELIQINTLRNLEYLIIQKSTLSIEFFQILKEILRQSNKLIELDVSENRINKHKFEILCQGITLNNSLQILNIANIKLNDSKCQMLIQSLLNNKTIKQIDLSRNNITQQSYYHFFKVFKNNITQIEKLKFSKTKKKAQIKIYPDYKFDFFINFDGQEPNSLLFFNLTTLDLSRVKYQQANLELIINRIKPDSILQNVTKLMFNECQFQDSHCEQLQQLLLNQLKLKELSLDKNNITSDGFYKIFNIILQNKSQLEKLTISNNQIENTILQSNCEQKLSFFKLLIIDNNKALGTQDLLLFLKNNKGLYIYNTWSQISEELAIQIIESYILYSVNYHIKNTPDYLKNLIIRDSNLTDNFLIWFGTKYFNFQQLECIDFSGSTKFSTSVGKMHMYISMINEQFMEYNLISGKIDNQQRIINIFDDGILYYLLIKLKMYILKRNNSMKWIIQIINKKLYQYTDFKLSSSLYKFLRQNKVYIRTYCVIQLILVPIQAILSVILAFYYDYNIDPREMKIDCKYQNPCYFSTYNEYAILISLIYFLLVLYTQVLNLYVAVKIRVKAVPDYCIRTFEEKKFQIYKYPHKQELFQFFILLFISADYYFEFQVIGLCGSFIDYLQDNNLMKELQYKFFVQLFVLSSVAITKFIIVIYTNYINMYNLMKNLDADQATLFSYIWKMSENNYVLENILRQYCPQIGIQVKNHLLNSRQIQELLQALLIDLPSFICISTFYSLATEYYESQFTSHIIPSAYFLFMIANLRVIVGFFFHLNIALTTRPPQVNGFDLNQTLLQRKYQSFQKECEKQPYGTYEPQEDTKLMSTLMKYRSEKQIIVALNKKEN